MRPRARTEALSITRLRQLVLIGMGWTIMAVGVVVIPLPGPFGVPMVIVGGLLLLRNSADARKLLIRWKRKPPERMRPLVARLEAWRERRRMKRRG